MLRVVVAASVICAAAGVRAQDPDTPLSPLELALACSPPPVLDGAPAALRLMVTQETVPRRLMGNRDLVIVNGGTDAGVLLGQQFFVRRSNRFGGARATEPAAITTLGWIRVVAANNSIAIALVEHACGGMVEGDYLQPYSRPILPAGADRDDPAGEPDFTSLARVLAGNENRQAAAAGDFVLIDRGADQGVTPGTRVALYRDVRTPGVPLASIGEAVVMTVGPSASLTRITRARDAVLSGDYVAIRR